MTDYRRYVPVLRWRTAEQAALRDLTDDVRAVVTPLIELLPSRTPLHDDAPRRAYLADFVNELGQVWGPRRTFVDTHLLGRQFQSAGKSLVNEAISRARSAGVDLVPVLTLPRDLDVRHLDVFASRSEREGGACLRLKPLDFELPPAKRAKFIARFLRHAQLDPAEVDLVVDEEFTYDAAPGYDRIAQMTPHLHEWRSFTIISGDFPPDLQEFQSGLIHSRRRNDWQRWSTQVLSGIPPRVPSYGDYTVQYAAYRPLAQDQIPRPSVSVRYTTEDTWLICRGEATRDNGPGTEQWAGWAQLLRDMPQYKGEAFSAGDRYINERACDGATHGNFTTWISAAINHHLTLATRQVASLRAA